MDTEIKAIPATSIAVECQPRHSIWLYRINSTEGTHKPWVIRSPADLHCHKSIFNVKHLNNGLLTSDKQSYILSNPSLFALANFSLFI